MVGEDLEVRLLEANSKPAFCAAHSVPLERPACRTTPCAQWLINATRRMEEEKIELVRELHEQHGGLGGLEEGEVYRGGGFTLIYSQQQRDCDGRADLDPCTMMLD